eukprot:3940461-Rhodomonas_salina.2
MSSTSVTGGICGTELVLTLGIFVPCAALASGICVPGEMCSTELVLSSVIFVPGERYCGSSCAQPLRPGPAWPDTLSQYRTSPTCARYLSSVHRVAYSIPVPYSATAHRLAVLSSAQHPSCQFRASRSTRCPSTALSSASRLAHAVHCSGVYSASVSAYPLQNTDLGILGGTRNKYAVAIAQVSSALLLRYCPKGCLRQVRD